MKIVYALLIVFLLTVSCASALIVMNGKLKGFGAGASKNIGQNRMSVQSAYTPTTMAPPAKAAKSYSRPIPSAYNFAPLNRGINGRPTRFVGRFER